MIQMRWVLEHRGYIEKERVLQYRIHTKINLTHGKAAKHQTWTDWIDVPEVAVTNPDSDTATDCPIHGEVGINGDCPRC